MNKEQLKELVKQHFNLVDRTPVKETFGEMYDENKAFKFKINLPLAGEMITSFASRHPNINIRLF